MNSPKPKLSEIFRAFETVEERVEVLTNIGWTVNKYLPMGWLSHKAEVKRIKVMTPEGKVIESRQKMLDFLMNSKEYQTADIERFLFYPDGVGSKAAKNKFQNMKMKQEVEDVVESSVAEGDKMEDVEEEEEEQRGEAGVKKNLLL